MPHLSVIIPLYNAAMLLDRCLDSIFSQTTTYTFEVILVDDGSTDDTVEVVRRRSETNIRLVSQQNAGPATARNRGVGLATGEFCTYVDADDYWSDGYIQKSLDFMYAHPECVAVNVAQRHCSPTGSSVIRPEYLAGQGIADSARTYRTGTPTEPVVLDDFYSFWTEHEHVGTCSTTIRRDILMQTGGQRTDLRICEDMEFWPYLASYGRWGFIPEILYVSDGGAITNVYGWEKYVRRFRGIQTFDSWFSRLSQRLTKEQTDILRPQLNGVVCGISRALISGGEFMRSYRNLTHYVVVPDTPLPYIVKVRRLGIPAWYAFSLLYRTYQYLKINRGVIRSRLHI